MTKEIHVELPPPIIERDKLNRPKHPDAGVVDQAGQLDISQLRDRGSDGRGIGNIKLNTPQIYPGGGFEILSILRPAHAGDDRKSRFRQIKRANPPDAGTATCYQNMRGF